jgi:hypothetical protein
MMLWLYDLNLWILGSGVVALSVAVAWSVCLAARRFGWLIRPEDQGPAGLMHQFIGVLYAVALALIVVSVQGSYAQVEQAVVNEASAASNLYRHLDGLEEPGRSRFQKLTRQYLDSAIEVEWPLQRNNQLSESTWQIVDEIERELSRFWPPSPHDQALIPALLQESTNLLDRRRERLFVGQQGIGATLWVVIVIGGIVTIGYACAFDVRSLRTHLAVTGMMAAMFGLMAFLIIAMDHPLWGDVSVTPEALITARQNIIRVSAGSQPRDLGRR